MSEPNTATPAAAAASKLLPLQTMLIGRIEAVERKEKYRYTRVIAPSDDRFSSPEYFEVRSSGAHQLGQVGDDVRVLCRLRGYKRKPKTYTDKNGEIRTFVPMVMSLDLVD